MRFEKEDTEICLVENEKTQNDNGESKVMNLGFQVADVKKPLIAVKRITEKGNHVAFRPKPQDNVIWNQKFIGKMMLKANGEGSM